MPRNNSDNAWKAWGKQDPYYGVLSDERFRRENITKEKSNFFLTGEMYVSRRLGEIERALGPVRRDRAFDFGCGVGRVAIPMAAHFAYVQGVDISPDMIAEAKVNAQLRGVINVDFAESDSDISAANGSFDFVHTYIVLHIFLFLRVAV